MQQYVAAVAGIYHDLARGTVAGDHDGAAGRVDAVAESLGPRPVMHRKRGHREIALAVDHARFHVVRRYLVPGGIGALEPVDADIDILLPGGFEVAGHGRGSCGPVEVERLLPAQHPGSENQVRQPHGVVGMQMCEEDSIQLRRFQGRDLELPGCRGRAAHYARENASNKAMS